MHVYSNLLILNVEFVIRQGFFFDAIETIEQIHIECKNTRSLWRGTEDWARTIYECPFKIADIEKNLWSTCQ